MAYENLSSKIVIPTYVSSNQPTFVWYNSTDLDSDLITYQIQLGKYGNWEDPSSFTEDSIPQASGSYTSYQITGTIDNDITYSWRVRAYDGYEYSDWSTTFFVYHAVSTSIVHDLGATVLVKRYDGVDLNSRVAVVASGSYDLSAVIGISTNVDLSAQLYIYPYSNLNAKVEVAVLHSNLYATLRIISNSNLRSRLTVTHLLGAMIYIYPTVDLGATVSIPINTVLSAKIKTISYYYRNLMAKIFVKGTSDPSATVYVIPKSDLRAQIRVPTLLGGMITIPAGLVLGGKLTNETPPGQKVGGLVNVTIPQTELTSNLAAKINVDTSLQEIDGYINIFDVPGASGIPSRVNVEVDEQELGGSLVVQVSGYRDTLKSSVLIDSSLQRLGGSVIVMASGYRDTLKASALISSEPWQVGGSVTVEVSGWVNPHAQINTLANKPSGVYAVGYVVPSGFPPAPSGWYSDELMVPPSGATIVPSGIWQAETDILFVWQPDDWGYGATKYGWMASWNDDAEYTVTDSDQYIPDNYIVKSWYDAGSKYFHIAAKNSYGWIGPTTTYEVRINTVPSAVTTPLYVEFYPNPSGLVHANKPTFTWGNAEDIDQLDLLTYELEIVYANNDIVTYTDIPQATFGYTTSYRITSYLPIGDYTWRVRAFDSKQYGPWSSYYPLSISQQVTDFGAKLTIPVRKTIDFGAIVNIKGYSNLSSSIAVYNIVNNELKARVKVCYPSDVELGATIALRTNVNLGAKLFVKGYKNLNTRINIINVVGGNNFNARVNVCRYIDTELLAKIRPYYKSSGDLSACVNIAKNVNFPAWVQIYTPEHYSFIPDFRTDFNATITVSRKTTTDLRSQITTLEDKPGVVTVHCSVPEATWQTDNLIDFTWDSASYNINPIEGYYTQLDRTPIVNANDSFQKTVNFNRQFNLEEYQGSSVYYFHIAAKNVVNKWGPTTHFEVRYNHVPSNVIPPLTVNNSDSYTATPTVSKTSVLVFRWGQSYDQDVLDVITYRLQIATKEDFLLDDYGNSSIVYDVSSIPSFERTIAGGTITSGVFYWRVKANDGNQDSASWSPIGSIRINTIPGTPTGLSVYRA